MATKEKIASTDRAWDDGSLGRDEAFVKKVKLDEAQEHALDDALELQMISIRLQKSLIEELKLIAQLNGGIGYQPLIRQVLKRFVHAELKKIAKDKALQLQQQKEQLRAAGATPHARKVA